MRLIKIFAGALLAPLALPVANAADATRNYPDRPVRIITGSPGSTSDIVPRFLANKLAGVWGQQIVVDNRPGANSIIGTEMVARAAPDGYTYLLTTGSHTTNAALHPKLPYDTLKDFIPLTLIGESAGMVIGVTGVALVLRKPDIPATEI